MSGCWDCEESELAPLSPVSILGEVLADELDARGWSRQEFAGRLGLADPAIADIVNGRVHIGPTLARQIGHALGTSAEMWERLDQTPPVIDTERMP